MKRSLFRALAEDFFELAALGAFLFTIYIVATSIVG